MPAYKILSKTMLLGLAVNTVMSQELFMQEETSEVFEAEEFALERSLASSSATN